MIKAKRDEVGIVLGEWHVFAGVMALGIYSRPSVGVVLGQRRRQFADIEPAMVCDAGSALNRNWEGRTTSCVRCK